MAKLLVLLAAFAAFLLIAEASLKVTTIIDEENRGSCQQQMREQQNMRNCKQMMMRQVRGGGRYNQQGMERDPSFRMCCSEMRQMDSSCRCRNLEDMMRMMQRQGQMQMEDTRMAMGMAENLPRKCGMDYPRRCDFSSRYVVY